MNTERNRIESLEPGRREVISESWNSNANQQKPQRPAFGQFAIDFRPAMSNMLQEVSKPGVNVDSIVEESLNRFFLFQQTCDWSRTFHLRSVMEVLLNETLANYPCAHGVGDIPRRFAICWRNHLVSECWHRQQQKEQETGTPYHSVLRRRYDKPWLSNGLLVQDLSDVFQAPPCKQSFRVFLYRCEKQFARSIVNVVADTIHLPHTVAVRNEILALDLEYFWDRLYSAAAAIPG